MFAFCPNGDMIPVTEGARRRGTYTLHMYDKVNLADQGWFFKTSPPDQAGAFDFHFAHPLHGTFNGAMTTSTDHMAWSREI